MNSNNRPLDTKNPLDSARAEISAANQMVRSPWEQRTLQQNARGHYAGYNGANPGSVYTATPGAGSSNSATGFTYGQRVLVHVAGGGWVPGTIVGALHFIERSGGWGYTVGYSDTRGRNIEAEFLQGQIRAESRDGHYS